MCPRQLQALSCCISSTMSYAGSHTVSVMGVSGHLPGLCPPHSSVLLPFPDGGFIQSTNWPLCPCGSAAFAESLAPEACKIPSFATVSLASRSHRPRFVKLEGPARRHLPTRWYHLCPSVTFSGRFWEVPGAGDSSLCFSTNISFLWGFLPHVNSVSLV